MGRIKEELLKQFAEDLKSGKLHLLLEKLKGDDTLSLEFRENYMSIYYRGGCISKLVYDTISNSYNDYFNTDYNTQKDIENDESTKETNKANNIQLDEDCIKLIKDIIERKEIMNKYFTTIKSKMERQYQQMLEFENNKNERSNYTTIDIEYQKDNSRFDMLAVQRKRQKDYQNLKMAIIEIKYGIGAISGNSGVSSHFRDVTRLSKEEIENLITDAELIMKYKIDLGLIKMLPSIKNGFKIQRNNIDLIFIIGNIDIQSNNVLLREIEKIQNEITKNEELKSYNIEVKIFCPYLAGNVMFDKDILTLEEFSKVNQVREELN